MSSATSGKGTLLKREGVTIAEVRSISGPSMQAETIDVTNMDSGGWREFITSLKDAGEVSFDVNFLPAGTTHLALLQDFVDSVISEYSLVWTDAGTSTWTFDGLVTSFQPSAAIADALTASVTIKVSGAPTIEGVS
jgi:predicted secreted protein